MPSSESHQGDEVARAESGVPDDIPDDVSEGDVLRSSSVTLDFQSPKKPASTIASIEVGEKKESQSEAEDQPEKEVTTEQSAQHRQGSPRPLPQTPRQSSETSSQSWQTAPKSWETETVFHTPFTRLSSEHSIISEEERGFRRFLSAESCPKVDIQPRRKNQTTAIAAPLLAPPSYVSFQSAFDEAVGVILPGNDPLYNTQLLTGTPWNLEPALDSLLLTYRDGKLIIPLYDLDPDPHSPPHDVAEPAHRFKARLTHVIQQMMYVSGETAEPSVDTTSIIEDIVRQQVIELLRQCTDLASRRGSRSININDLIFQIRHDTAKVSRLRTFLSWKDVRKNVKDSDDKGGDADLGAGEDPSGGVVAGGPVDDTTKKNKKGKVGLPWEPSSFFSQEVPERDDEEDEEEEEMNFITLQRLRKADERTKAMTREEYVTWSEYRQASFTYRKGKRFREWAGFGIVTDSKPSDDIVDILGFLTFEMVQTLTENALKVKEQEEALKAMNGGAGEGDGASKKRKRHPGLFDPPSEGKTPIGPRHVQEAFRRLQARGKKSRAMLNGTRLAQHSALTIF
ncbi:transcription initiation factor IID, 18kD subunit-domain-containing protein [Plectosphaerella cucumerina]|uniref:Transcription initiation factor IID, 18kD subunit-domain-containing protein n=1 Tax=Plectosphaerella cucumerina TaxID=40658 RepID=A0A8K0TQ03_9PEZI|nr:transcription initiation factor IID, 18kD subunit-domain-containing protein [Plectosphaerella cucumerina]